MSGRIRVNVKFGETKVLVPCGDGSISVKDMIDKAIDKFRKLKKLNKDDQIIVDNLFQEDGSFVDTDDNVDEVLDDKDTVILVYKLIPHDSPSDFEPELINSLNSMAPPSLHLPSVGVNDSAQNSLSYTSPMSSQNDQSQNTSLPISSGGGDARTDFSGSFSYQSNGAHSPRPSPFDTTSYHPSSPAPYPTEQFTTPPFTPDDGPYYSPNDYNGRDATIHKSASSGDSGIKMAIDEHTGFTNSQDPNTGLVAEDNRELSQINDMEDHLQFSEEPPTHSQISIHSEVSSHPSNSQRYHDNLSYETDLLTPEGPRHTHPMSKPSPSEPSFEPEPPSSTPNTTFISNSQRSKSIEHLSSEYQQPGGGAKAYGRSTNHLNFLPAPAPLRMAQSMSHMSLSQQEMPPMHSQPQDLYIYDPGSGGFVMTQPEGSGWHRMHPHMGPRYWPHYDPNMMRGMHRMSLQPPGRPGMDHMGMGDRMATMPENKDQMGYPPPHQTPYNDYQERRKRFGSTSTYDDTMMGGAGRGGRYSHPHTRSWGMKEDDQGYPQRMRGFEDESIIDYNLSQPVQFGTYGGQLSGGYHGAPMAGHPMPHYNRMSVSSGGIGNVPSGYSLSQPAPGMRASMGRLDRTKQIKSALKNRSEQSPRSDRNRIEKEEWKGSARLKTFSEDPTRDRDIDALSDTEEEGPSPFQRAARKSMFMDWRDWEDKYMNMEEDDYDELPVYNGEPSQSQRSISPTHSGDGKEVAEDNESNEDIGNLHIVELLRGDEALGIHLVSYTSKGRDLGVFIGALDENGFAAKSGKLEVSDRLLACNGEDFTIQSNAIVEERFREMAKTEPLLRMAISRGFNFDLDEPGQDETEERDHNKEEREIGAAIASKEPAETVPTISSNSTTAIVTNTRQIGMKYTIQIPRGQKGTFGFGLSSRDVATNDQDHPIYVKFINPDGPAFQDGRLKIGDRILEVDGISVKGKTQSEVVELLKRALDKVTLIVSRQETVEVQDEFNEVSETSPVPPSVGKNIIELDIPLNNCGLAGLGVTVHGKRGSSRRHSSDMGIYIKSIVPGGAAAQDGRLRTNDQLLSVNGQSLVNMSNSDALEALKKALQQATRPGDNPSIQLTIVRTAGINRKQSLSMSSFSSQMPALKEEERYDSEARGEREETNEVGIDCPPELKEKAKSRAIDVSPRRSVNMDLSPSSSLDRRDHTHDRQHKGSGAGEPYSTSRTGRYSTEQHQGSPPKTSDSSWYSRCYSDKSLDRKHEKVHQERSLDHTDSAASYPRHNSMSPMSTDPMAWYVSDNKSSSLDRRGMSRSNGTYIQSPSFHNDLSSSYNSHTYSMTDHSSSNSSSMSFPSSRNGSFRRKVSPPYDTLEESTSKERGSIRETSMSYTLPRSGTGRSSGRSGRESPGVTSLISYASDSEIDNPFKRDDKNRLSIPKKKTGQPQPKYNYLRSHLANIEPRLEGEGPPSPPLYRTESDGDISSSLAYQHNNDMFRSVEVGPSLRMAKSSSLESLQTVMHYTVRANIHQEDSNMMRTRPIRRSFRNAVDPNNRHNSSDNLSSATVISLTKSPKKAKQSKRGLLKWIKTRKTKNRKDKSRRSHIASGDFENSIEELAKEFGLSQQTLRRMQSHSGRIEGEDEDDHDSTKDNLDVDMDSYDSLPNNFQSRAL